MEKLLEFYVITDHKPRPKGSLLPEKGVGGRIRMKESVDPEGVWRGLIANAARKAARDSGLPGPITQAVCIRAIHYFPWPGEVTVAEHPFPTRRRDGDVEKLYRNIGDALQDAKVLADDALVMAYDWSPKLWAAPGRPAGAHIGIFAAGPSSGWGGGGMPESQPE